MPDIWRKARLVLLLKPGKEKDSPTAYRPIYLLEEESKVLERIIIERIRKVMEAKGRDLADEQYGFRQRRSTNNALEEVRRIVNERLEEEGVACTISVNIKNAFNTIPWDCIEEGLKVHGIPGGLRKIVMSYFENRSIEYKDRDGNKRTRNLEVGLPQGTVMGPTLWNVAYDRILGTAIPTGGRVVCYADVNNCGRRKPEGDDRKG